MIFEIILHRKKKKKKGKTANKKDVHNQILFPKILVSESAMLASCTY